MDFFEKWQYPNCLSALDGKHICIQSPGHSGSTFHNYKSSFSVVRIAVADAHYKFVYVSVGGQGRLSDGGLFAYSVLHRAMDAGLSCRTCLLQIMHSPYAHDLQKPFSHRQLDHDQRIYNYRLLRAREVVETHLAFLPTGSRVFRTTISLDPDKVVKITLASCVIHNFLRACRSEPYVPPTLTD